MAYIVRYGGQVPVTHRKKNRVRGKWLAAVGILATAAAVEIFWPEGVEAFRSLLIPGQDAVTMGAFLDLVSGLQEGEGFSECMTAFCREVIYGAQ